MHADTAARPSLQPASRPAPTSMYLVGERERSHARPRGGADGRTMVCVNGRWHAIRGRTLSHEQVMALVDPDHGRGVGAFAPRYDAATVSYRRGEASRPSGLLTPGDPVTLVEGLLVNVAVTQAS